MQIVTKMFKTRTQQKILKSLDMRSDETIPDQAYWEAQENRPLCIGIFGTPKSASTFVWRIFLDLAGALESRSTFDHTKNHRGLHELDVSDIIRQRLQYGKWISHSCSSTTGVAIPIGSHNSALSIRSRCARSSPSFGLARSHCNRLKRARKQRLRVRLYPIPMRPTSPIS